MKPRVGDLWLMHGIEDPVLVLQVFSPKGSCYVLIGDLAMHVFNDELHTLVSSVEFGA